VKFSDLNFYGNGELQITRITNNTSATLMTPPAGKRLIIYKIITDGVDGLETLRFKDE